MEKAEKQYIDAMTGFERCVKRIIDFTFALCCIVVLSPLLLVISILVFLSGGDVIYRQERVGYHGKPLPSISSVS